MARKSSLVVCTSGLLRIRSRILERIARLHRVPALVTHEGCQVNALVGYFGEQRDTPCGHCSFCLSGAAQALPIPDPQPPIEALVDRAELRALVAMHPDALGAPRQRARFLCGITSPATSKARLGKHRLFGRLSDQRFADVLAWREDAAARTPVAAGQASAATPT